jgi:hypothetical protein
MAKHWAEDYYDAEALAPHPGDEELFLTIQLMGESAVVEQFLRPIVRVLRSVPEAERRSAIEQFCIRHHAQGDGAVKGVWVRYEIWRDRYLEAQVAAQKTSSDS